MSLFGTADRTQAQTYPIDCAILLCLSGGWPASEPCSRARAEFIRRFTPWPVEPPLQIWRCPMGASYQLDDRNGVRGRIYDVLFDGAQRPLPRKISEASIRDIGTPVPAVLRGNGFEHGLLPEGFAPRFVQDRADIDISGPEFNFVRSIRVFDVRFASQRESGEKNECMRFASVYLGTYGIQGEFTWQLSSPSAVPEAHIGLEGWGEGCPMISNRSVFVDWRDYRGNYGFEQVNY
ncbi:hypothetical protein [Roseovarius pelagicus]|uniref:Uncharacterized protein n=1 Tax=Roseovarius pelagicus TaxID=2980108 RepID=A0ABY6DGZ6_9RHOB|nr:hypothetical protein [Roseovarius pelagicus]UXX85401.1 hypothetical protein N7U68_20760 [Roseovarius pelagicus]